MDKKFSQEVNQVIRKSRDVAMRLGHDFIGTEHLLLGIMEDRNSLAVRVLDSLDVEIEELVEAVENSIRRAQASTHTSLKVGNLPLSRQAEKVLKVTILEAKKPARRTRQSRTFVALYFA